MRSFELRSALLLTLSLGLFACPSGDSNDEGTDTVTTTESAETTMSGEGSTTEPADGSTTEPTGGTTGGTTGGELILADIKVKVIYEGMATGTLNVVAITEFPPKGPPVAVASDDMPTFPYEATLNDLEVGEYIIFATLDVGANNPTMPGPEDPVSSVVMPVVVTVDGPGPFMAEVTLIDPM